MVCYKKEKILYKISHQLKDVIQNCLLNYPSFIYSADGNYVFKIGKIRW